MWKSVIYLKDKKWYSFLFFPISFGGREYDYIALPAGETKNGLIKTYSLMSFKYYEN